MPEAALTSDQITVDLNIIRIRILAFITGGVEMRIGKIAFICGIALCLSGCFEGPQGPKGEKGAKGDKGDPGEKGPAGAPGTTLRVIQNPSGQSQQCDTSEIMVSAYCTDGTNFAPNGSSGTAVGCVGAQQRLVVVCMKK